jgi:RimJ/RimL family protein N-acetyltransferase
MIVIETERLILRTWKAKDAKAYFEINQDPKVIEFLLGPLRMEQVQNFMAQQNANQQEFGYGLWAVEIKETGQPIGFIEVY